MKLKGKVALITGSGSGMGRAAAVLFAKEGAKMMVSDVNDKGGQETVEMIRKAGGEASYVHADTAVVADLENMVKATVRTYGKLNIFWHNAGVAGPGRIDRVTEAAYDRTMDIHCKGGFFGSKFAIPEIQKAGEGGSILFTSSVSGVKPSPASPVYSMSKATLVILTRCLAVYLGKDNIRVNCICPGPVETPLYPDFVGRDPDLIKPEELQKMMLGNTVFGRFARPEEIAQVALFLVSDDASYVTGVIMPVDAGMTAR